jgi:hypothetical protein
LAQIVSRIEVIFGWPRVDVTIAGRETPAVESDLRDERHQMRATPAA